MRHIRCFKCLDFFFIKFNIQCSYGFFNMLYIRCSHNRCSNIRLREHPCQRLLRHAATMLLGNLFQIINYHFIYIIGCIPNHRRNIVKDGHNGRQLKDSREPPPFSYPDKAA